MFFSESSSFTTPAAGPRSINPTNQSSGDLPGWCGMDIPVKLALFLFPLECLLQTPVWPAAPPPASNCQVYETCLFDEKDFRPLRQVLVRKLNTLRRTDNSGLSGQNKTLPQILGSLSTHSEKRVLISCKCRRETLLCVKPVWTWIFAKFFFSRNSTEKWR